VSAAGVDGSAGQKKMLSEKGRKREKKGEKGRKREKLNVNLFLIFAVSALEADLAFRCKGGAQDTRRRERLRPAGRAVPCPPLGKGVANECAASDRGQERRVQDV